MITKNPLEGRQDGETVWIAMTSVESTFGEGVVIARSWVHEAEVFSVAHGLIQQGKHATPRGVYRGSETVHATAEGAWLAVAADHERAAATLLAEAAECRRKAAVAGRVEAA